MIRNVLSCLLILSITAVTACGDSDEDSNNVSNNGATNNGNNGGVTTVTVGVYLRTGEDTYEKAAGAQDLVYQVGVTCQTWSRAVNNPSPMDAVQEPHDHYNAADDVVYENGQLSWVEYGPEHSQGEIDANCASGSGGAVKSGINDTDFYFDGNMGETNDDGEYIGFYLRIDGVE